MIDLAKVDRIIDKHGGACENLIGMLLDCQDEFRYLPRELLQHVADRVGVPLSKVAGIATFYRGFSLKPKGRFPVDVCTGTACHVLGAPKLVAAFEREFGVKLGDTTPDGEFSLHAINCLGFCGQAPAVRVSEDMYGKVTQVGIKKIVKKYRPQTAAREA